MNWLILREFAWIFLIYGFVGWCTEVIFAAVNSGKFVNRGFLNGPICPIYGFGILAVVRLLKPFGNNILLLFVGSVLITSGLEYITGFLLEKLFHQKWWDYSDVPFNIQGYICSLGTCLHVHRRNHPSACHKIHSSPAQYLKYDIVCSIFICCNHRLYIDADQCPETSEKVAYHYRT